MTTQTLARDDRPSLIIILLHNMVRICIILIISSLLLDWFTFLESEVGPAKRLCLPQLDLGFGTKEIHRALGGVNHLMR